MSSLHGGEEGRERGGDRRRQTAEADVSVSPAPCPTCIFKEQLCSCCYSCCMPITGRNGDSQEVRALLAYEEPKRSTGTVINDRRRGFMEK